jgi:hypothetical protein
MKTKLSGKLSHYDKMAASAQQFFTEATACREEAARSLDQVDREGWLKLAREWTELALAAERARFSAGISGAVSHRCHIGVTYAFLALDRAGRPPRPQHC